MSETNCKACGQRLPADQIEPVRKTGIVKWFKRGKEAAIEVDGELYRAWSIYCPTLKEVGLAEGDRVELMVRPDKDTPIVMRIALPAQALTAADADTEAGV